MRDRRLLLNTVLKQRRLPFTDSFARSNGALGNGWTGATWTIASGEAVNTPTFGAEKLANPGFEGTYVAGVAPNWSRTSGNLSESADVHGGTAAQQVNNSAGALGDCRSGVFALTAGQWVTFSRWAKVLAGYGYFSLSQNFGSFLNLLTNVTTGGAYGQKIFHTRIPTTGNHLLKVQAETNASADTNRVLYDDASAMVATQSTLFALRESGSPNITIEIALTMPNGAPVGAIVCADALSNPSNFILPYIANNGGNKLYVDKWVNGSFASVLAGTAITYVAGAILKIIKSGSSLDFYYNGAQIGTTQTVSDATIVNNTKHGMFSIGDSTIGSFFLA